ncbi:MAG: hypothetical protein PHT07_23120 [Paludibacter sp.]|nr:hypothetical protein [Paludibacter sp.]
MMTQKTLDGKTDCREERKKGSATIVFHGKNQDIINHLTNLKKKHACFRITINHKKLDEEPNPWDAKEPDIKKSDE